MVFGVCLVACVCVRVCAIEEAFLIQPQTA